MLAAPSAQGACGRMESGCGGNRRPRPLTKDAAPGIAPRGRRCEPTYKPRSVPRRSRFTGLAALLPETAAWAIIYLGPRVAAGLKRPTRGSRGTSRPPSRRNSPLLGLAPGGGCLAAGIAADAGGLLHHLFTLTSAVRAPRGRAFPDVEAVVFCGPIPGPILTDGPARVLPGTVLWGARTFLERPFDCAQDRPRSPGRIASTFIIAAPSSAVNVQAWTAAERTHKTPRR